MEAAPSLTQQKALVADESAGGRVVVDDEAAVGGDGGTAGPKLPVGSCCPGWPPPLPARTEARSEAWRSRTRPRTAM